MRAPERLRHLIALARRKLVGERSRRTVRQAAAAVEAAQSVIGARHAETQQRNRRDRDQNDEDEQGSGAAHRRQPEPQARPGYRQEEPDRDGKRGQRFRGKPGDREQREGQNRRDGRPQGGRPERREDRRDWKDGKRDERRSDGKPGSQGKPREERAPRFDPDSPANYRRSVYRFLVRSVPDPFMERFDCPDVSMITAKRSATITAIQALALMNNPFVLAQAGHLAARIGAVAGSPEDQVMAAFRFTLQRRPDAREVAEMTQYLSREGLPNLCRLLLNTNEFIFVD